MQALFIRYDLPADFLQDLDDDIAAFEQTDDSQDDGRGKQVGGTAGLADGIKRGMNLRGVLDAIVRNKYRGNNTVLAEWASASDIPRRRRSSGTTPAPTP